MAFPASGKVTLRQAWDGVTYSAANIKRMANSHINMGAITRLQVLMVSDLLADCLIALDSYTVVQGLLAYARNELNNTTIDLATEYTIMRVQIVATQDWIVANFPKDAAGNLAVYAFNTSKKHINIDLTSEQLTAFKAQLSALVATIN